MARQERDRHASKQLADALRERIADGSYPPGVRLPSYRRLRDEHAIALNTAQAAIRILAADGLAEIRPGSGAYVRDKPPEVARPLRAELTELRDSLRQSRRDLAAAEEKVAAMLSRLPADEPVD
jgi:DNA-binding FadR family transcriptional regulator